MCTSSIFGIFNIIVIHIGNAFLMLPFQCIEFFFLRQKSFPKLDFLLILQNTKETREQLAFDKIFLLNVTERDPICPANWIRVILNNLASIYSLGKFIICELPETPLLKLLLIN